MAIIFPLHGKEVGSIPTLGTREMHYGIHGKYEISVELFVLLKHRPATMCSRGS